MISHASIALLGQFVLLRCKIGISGFDSAFQAPFSTAKYCSAPDAN